MLKDAIEPKRADRAEPEPGLEVTLEGGGGGGGEVVVAVPGEGRGGRDLDSVGEVRYEVGLVFICQGMGL